MAVPTIAAVRESPGLGSVGSWPEAITRRFLYERVGAWSLTDKLGSGVYGVAFRAENLETKEVAALKIVLEEGGSAEWEYMAKSLLIETAAQQVMTHPNVLPICQVLTLDVLIQFTRSSPFVQTRFLAFVMPLMTGGSLRAQILSLSGSSARQLHDRLAWVGDIACGLGYMHAQGFVHGDLKPDNVLLGVVGRKTLGAESPPRLAETPARWTAVVADFGLSFLVWRQKKTNGLSPNHIYSLWYRAPEMLCGSTDFGAPADAWAFGVLCLELLLNFNPFSGVVRGEMEMIDLIGEDWGFPPAWVETELTIVRKETVGRHEVWRNALGSEIMPFCEHNTQNCNAQCGVAQFSGNVRHRMLRPAAFVRFLMNAKRSRLSGRGKPIPDFWADALAAWSAPVLEKLCEAIMPCLQVVPDTRSLAASQTKLAALAKEVAPALPWTLCPRPTKMTLRAVTLPKTPESKTTLESTPEAGDDVFLELLEESKRLAPLQAATVRIAENMWEQTAAKRAAMSVPALTTWATAILQLACTLMDERPRRVGVSLPGVQQAVEDALDWNALRDALTVDVLAEERADQEAKLERLKEQRERQELKELEELMGLTLEAKEERTLEAKAERTLEAKDEKKIDDLIRSVLAVRESPKEAAVGSATPEFPSRITSPAVVSLVTAVPAEIDDDEDDYAAWARKRMASRKPK